MAHAITHITFFHYTVINILKPYKFETRYITAQITDGYSCLKILSCVCWKHEATRFGSNAESSKLHYFWYRKILLLAIIGTNHTDLKNDEQIFLGNAIGHIINISKEISQKRDTSNRRWVHRFWNNSTYSLTKCICVRKFRCEILRKCIKLLNRPQINSNKKIKTISSMTAS